MNTQLTLGSLFDGIGGFPLAGIYAGITPIWASEIEPFPIRVTEKRLPNMRHYGDICTLDGAKLEPVDIITGGFPCQSCSIAGKREGVKHKARGDDETTRSGLFYEAVRVIREMRSETNGRYPRYFVAENVPGLFSSAGGEDFRAVLEEICKIKDGEAAVPRPAKNKWSDAGLILGNGYSVAWRVLDAQFFGVAQRRRRVFIVADFGGERAGKILFESEGVSGYTPPGGAARQGIAGSTETGAGAAGVVVLNDMGGQRMDVTHEEALTLRANMRGHAPCVLEASGFCTEHSASSRSVGYEAERSPTLRAGVVPGVAIEYDSASRAYGISSFQSHAMLSDNPHAGIYEAETSRTLDCNGGAPSNNQGGLAIVSPAYSVRPLINTEIQREQTPSLMARDHKDPVLVGQPSYCMTVGSYGHVAEEKTPTLEARGYKDPPVIGRPFAYSMDRAAFTSGENAQFRMCVEGERAPTLIAEGPSAVASSQTDYIVRRLTPGECCLLQGYPPGWTENLETESPTDAEIHWWAGVFGEWDRARGKTGKPKTRNQIVKWLKNPRTDGAEYKAFGNSVCVNCVFFILAGIVWADGLDSAADRAETEESS